LRFWVAVSPNNPKFDYPLIPRWNQAVSVSISNNRMKTGVHWPKTQKVWWLWFRRRLSSCLHVQRTTFNNCVVNWVAWLLNTAQYHTFVACSAFRLNEINDILIFNERSFTEASYSFSVLACFMLLWDSISFWRTLSICLLFLIRLNTQLASSVCSRYPIMLPSPKYVETSSTSLMSLLICEISILLGSSTWDAIPILLNDYCRKNNKLRT
jgi:hypothetical protein